MDVSADILRLLQTHFVRPKPATTIERARASPTDTNTTAMGGTSTMASTATASRATTSLMSDSRGAPNTNFEGGYAGYSSEPKPKARMISWNLNANAGMNL